MPKNILITGGHGFIGYNFYRYYNNKYNIINIDRQQCNFFGKRIDNTICKDIVFLTQNDYQYLKDNKVEIIIHFASISNVDYSFDNINETVRNNIEITNKVIELANYLNVPLIYFSTDEVFGELEEDSYIETEYKYNPTNFYSLSKMVSEYYLSIFKRFSNIDYKIINATNVYGEYQTYDKFIPLVINNILNNRLTYLNNNGKSKRQWIYVEDVCKILDFITDNYYTIDEERVFIAGQELSIIEVFNIISNHFNNKGLYQFKNVRKYDDIRYSLQSKFMEKYNFKCSKFNDTIKKVVDFYVNR
jgi:dTDP-glucose 4,6-dehydratase